MKKQITFLMLTLFFAFSTMQAQKNVLYINQDGVEAPSGSGASTPGDDPITRMLDADANFTLSYVEINQAFEVTKVGANNTGANVVGNTIDFTGFDLIIVSDTMASSNGIFQDGNPLHIDELTVPVIYSKTFAFRGGDAIDAARNGAAVTQTQNLSVTVLDTGSDMFSGIDFGGGSEIQLFRTTSDDKGNQQGPKAIDVLNGLENSASGTLLAAVEQVTTGEENKAAVINYIPSGTTLGTTNEVSTKDIVIFGFSYGATVKQDGGNVTSEYLTIWRNAAYKLTGQTIPTTLYTNPVYDKYELVTETTRYDFTDGSIIPNPEERYVIQGSPEANAAPQTDRLKSEDGRLDYRHAAGDNFHSTAYGLNMKMGSRVNLKPLGTSVVKVPLSQYSSFDFKLKMPNNNQKSYIKVNGVSTSAPSKTAYEEILNATAADGSDLDEFITIDFFSTVGNSQNLEFYSDGSVDGGSDIYLPYIDVIYTTLKRKPTKVLYVNQSGVGQGEGASAPGQDPVIKMLQADDNFVVTYVETPQDGSAIPDLSGFDMVIAQETISSGAAMFKPDGVLGINTVSIPIIYNKSWAFRNGKAVTDADAAVTGTQNLSVTVNATNQTNPIFSGIDFSGSNDVRIFKSATANDDGSAGGNKAIDVLNGLDFSNANAGTLATVPEVTDAAKSILINHIPAGTQLGEAATDVLGVDAITFAFSYGAQIFGDGANISPEALTIWRNAAYILAGLDVPTTLVENEAFFIPKKILYVNQVGVGQGEGASAPGQDPVIKMLMADEKFDVTYIETPSDGSLIDLAGFDLVIAQETISSGAAMFKPGGVLGVKDVTVPIIYNKSWAFRNGKAVTDADAAVTGTQNLSITATNTNHPLFSGIDFSGGDDIRIFKSATAKDDGSAGGNKAIDVLNDLEFSSTSAGSIATVSEITDADKAMLVNYMPAGTQLGENTADVLQVNAIGLAFSYGAQILGDGANISPEALTIWRNAAYMLAYGPSEVPTTLVENPAFFLNKKILYVNQSGVGQGEGASAPGEDPVIKMLQADDNFVVTYVETPQDGSAIPDLSGFDMVIAQETISSGAAMFKPDGVLGINTVSIPIIYNKSWAFRNGKAVTDADAAVTGTQNLSVTVNATNQTNPIFSGIDFSGSNDVRIFKSATANDDGSAGGNKAIDVLNGLDFSNANAGTLATVPEVTDAAKSILINHIPAGTQLGEAATDVLGVDAITFAFSYGAQIFGDGANISPEALTIWRNAAYILAGLDVPTTLVENEAFFIPKKILYVNQSGVGQGEGASAPGEDPVIKMLMADEKFDVTYIETPSDGSLIDLAGFDLVIAQETISSGAAMFKPGGVLGVKDVTVPIIYNKSWAFRNGKAVTDADAAVTGTQNLSVTVDVANQTHPLFSGIDFSGSNDVRIFKSATANDDGSAGGNKAIDVLNGLDFSNANAGTLATVPEVTDAAKSILINHIPAGTQLGEAATDVLGVDAITFAFSYGAQIFGDGTNISPEALTIWRNAAYMLAYGPSEVPTTLVENNDFTLSVDRVNEFSKVTSNLRSYGNTVFISNVESKTEVKVYSITGALVRSIKTDQDTQFELKSGLYIATVKTAQGTKAVKFITNR